MVMLVCYSFSKLKSWVWVWVWVLAVGRMLLKGLRGLSWNSYEGFSSVY